MIWKEVNPQIAQVDRPKILEWSSVQVCSSLESLLLFRSGLSVTASDFGSNGPRFKSGRGRCVESLDKALYSHCPKEKPSH